jgi:hypothetical protein
MSRVDGCLHGARVIGEAIALCSVFFDNIVGWLSKQRVRQKQQHPYEQKEPDSKRLPVT